MLDVVSKRSKIGKILDTLDVTNDDVAAACEVAPQTVSKWRNLDKNGKTHHTISYENLMRLIHFLQKKSDLSYDPVDLLEAPEHYVNTLKVIGTLQKNSHVKLFPRDRSVDVDNKFPPDRSAIEYKVNEDKIYYIVFDEMEYPPNSKVVHNCDVVFHFKKGQYIVGQDVQIGFDNQIKFVRRFTGGKDQTIKAKDVKCFYIITDIKIKNSR
tara:strand:- start:1187 stop:1819 length:633 start_codon:yes stop_codon:yes gene_type:complete